MKLFKFLFLSGFFLLMACNQESTPTTTSTNTSTDQEDAAAPQNYVLEDIPGSKAKTARLKNEGGRLLEEGIMVDGVKQGTWLYFEPGNDFPIKMVTFVDNLYNGPYLEFSNNGSIAIKAFYVNNKLDGHWAKYRFSRVEAEADYINGELEGWYKEYNFRDGKIKKAISYINGVQDGPMQFYDEEEKMTAEFIYKNGEKVSGGTIE